MTASTGILPLVGAAFVDFDDAAQAVLTYLRDRLGFSLWMLAQTRGEHWTVLQTTGGNYGPSPGDSFRWQSTYCYRMVQGLGPRIAPRSRDVEAYATLPIPGDFQIGAYVGVPIEGGGGLLFGTLCAIDPDPQPEAIAAELPTVELMARLLSTVLAAERAKA